MAFDLLNTLKQLFDSGFSAKAASQLGEPEPGVRKALNGILPAILTGVLNKAGTGDATALTMQVKEAAGSNFSDPSGALAGNMLSLGTDILRALFGNKTSQVTHAIAAYAGIKASSASALMQIAAPAALGLAGQQAGGQNMSTPNLLALLNNQKERILHAIPAGLGLAKILGASNLGDISRRLSVVAEGIAGSRQDTTVTVARQVRRRWIWMLIVLIVIPFVLWYWLRGCERSSSMQTTDTVTTTQMEDSAISEVLGSTPVPIKVTLPDGRVLDAYKGGMEDQLVSFLKDPNTRGSRETWFDFDNLGFKAGSAELTEESQLQVQNLAAILQAFPGTKVKIGGYTDRVGDSVANMQLSQERADAVLRALRAEHVQPGQLLGAEGYGSMFAKAPADAPNEERKLDRRVSVGVREK